MMKQVCMAALLAAMSAPAFAADDCGSLPIPPVIPTAAEITAKPLEIARKDVFDTYHLVKTYQGANETYRSCLVRMSKQDEAALGDAKAKGEDAIVKSIAARMDDREVVYKRTFASEDLIARDFNTMRMAHCGRGDTDPKVCPQKK